MKAEKLFCLVVGLIILAFVEGLIKAAWASFPLIEVLGFQNGIAGYIGITKLVNDRNALKYDAIKAQCVTSGGGQ